VPTPWGIKTVYFPRNIPVDDVAGTRRGRARALEACEEKGWEALPLAAEPLSDLLPELWSTPKAAERWMGNNPLNPNISIIRLWGVIHLYRPSGRRGKWSKTLVRHGSGPRMALAAVLEVAAQAIHVRGTARPKPPVKANTVPTPVPNNPSPSTEPMAQPSNAAPGSPS
jgi:hypothetical protein